MRSMRNGPDVHQLVGDGSALSPPQANELERMLGQHPSDLEARGRLLGYYDAVSRRRLAAQGLPGGMPRHDRQVATRALARVQLPNVRVAWPPGRETLEGQS
jgi:hypothetical protein